MGAFAVKKTDKNRKLIFLLTVQFEVEKVRNPKLIELTKNIQYF